MPPPGPPGTADYGYPHHCHRYKEKQPKKGIHGISPAIHKLVFINTDLIHINIHQMLQVVDACSLTCHCAENVSLFELA